MSVFLIDGRPGLLSEWHYEKNSIDVGSVTCGSHKKVWWKCGRGHEWKASVKNRVLHESNCPYCAGKIACKDNCLATLRPDLVKEWHQTKNNGLTPGEVVCGSHKKVWWQCNKKHEWKTAVYNKLKGRGCPYCSGQKVCEDNCLATLNPVLASEWHPTKNGELIPNDVTCGGAKKIWWVCEKGHEWVAAIYSRSKGSGCPYCSGRKVCKDNCLATLRPDLVKQWNSTKNGKLTPNDVTVNSHRRIWWKCDKGHEWETEVHHRTKGHGCPICSKGPISKISQEWLDYIGVPVKNREVLISELGVRVDGFDPRTKTVYEFLGDYWHGNPDRFNSLDINKHTGVSFGQLFKETKTRIFRLEEAGYKVVYAWESDFNRTTTNDTC